ncbi:MAG: FKBP-type peptidyl-prolyl cis-trans isomerase [Balneolaceae bacterium]|nr:FKBP-type peptidyl-prolyl cis-trans isomerase [Balneolaceae bacterium]
MEVYIIEQGETDVPAITVRDQVSLRYTGWAQDGTVFTSSYANGSTSPSTFSNLTPTTVGNTPALIEGFRKGITEDLNGTIEGMHIGEKRKLVIPPEFGIRRLSSGYQWLRSA